MRRLIGGTLVIVAIAGAFWAGLPWISDLHFERTCASPSPSCLNRARALGHICSRRGDFECAIGRYTWGADNGDRIAMFHLGWAKEREGREILRRTPLFSVDDTDPKLMAKANQAFAQAVLWYRQSAQQGFAPAMNNLGELYRSGLGVRPDLRAAHHWHRAAATAGNPVGVLNLAASYLDGRTEETVEAMSSWQELAPSKASPDDLKEPTFARTLWRGKALPEGRRVQIRMMAENDKVYPLQRPLQPDPRLPTFKRVDRAKLEEERHDKKNTATQPPQAK